jgi:hypothetical protein
MRTSVATGAGATHECSSERATHDAVSKDEGRRVVVEAAPMMTFVWVLIVPFKPRQSY